MRGLSAAPIRPAWRPMRKAHTASARLAMCKHIREDGDASENQENKD